MAFLPALFSPPLMLIGERAVYQFMSWLAPDDYTGGLWQFHEQGGQPLFLARGRQAVPPLLRDQWLCRRGLGRGGRDHRHPFCPVASLLPA